MRILQWVAADGRVVQLDGTEGIKVLRGVAGLEGTPLDMTLDPRVGSDGSAKSFERRPARPFLLPILVDDTVSVRQLASLFHPGGGSLVVTVEGETRTLRNIEYQAGLEGEWSAKAGGLTGSGWQKYPLNLLALEPVYYGDPIVVSLPVAAPTPFDAPIAFDASTPFNGGSTLPIMVVSDLDVYPVITADGPFDELTISAGGLSWQSVEPVVEGQLLVVDSRPGRKGPAFSAGPVDWSLLTAASRLWTLTPGMTSISVGAVGSTGSTTVSLSFEPRFLTP